MIELRPVEADADYEAWARIKTAVVPSEPTTVAEVRKYDGESGRLLLLADLDGETVACGITARSSFGGRAFMAVRVLPAFRRRGVGHGLVAALSEHARANGFDGVNAFVDAREPESIAFARSFGLQEIDYQLEQIRVVGDEPAPRPPGGVELVALGARRDELLHAAWPLAQEGYADMPTPQPMEVKLDEWLRDEATLPDGSFVAMEGAEIVGYAGLVERAEEDVAEHGFTVVRRDRRGRGIARALKRAEIHWASHNGIGELVTWTQRGNEAMQATNRSLGYVDRAKVLTFQGPLVGPDQERVPGLRPGVRVPRGRQAPEGRLP
ncbi:MAG TPA: GNAT family N-acetyltransferase [Gaiellaceae bacterium]